mmetsp:Transcript_55761/g.157062  ORF Transcript_55761/g.157062 Transcript_55761/m.157062 type:complete len:219 (+) Transcript_55761:91-747(+)
MPNILRNGIFRLLPCFAACVSCLKLDHGPGIAASKGSPSINSGCLANCTQCLASHGGGNRTELRLCYYAPRNCTTRDFRGNLSEREMEELQLLGRGRQYDACARKPRKAPAPMILQVNADFVQPHGALGVFSREDTKYNEHWVFTNLNGATRMFHTGERWMIGRSVGDPQAWFRSGPSLSEDPSQAGTWEIHENHAKWTTSQHIVVHAVMEIGNGEPP